MMEDTMPSADDDRILYEQLDMITNVLAHTDIGGNGYAEDVVRELLMRIMGLEWHSQHGDGAPGYYAVNPANRDQSTQVMRRWLKAHGFLPRRGHQLNGL
jgi:hypothetical protein